MMCVKVWWRCLIWLVKVGLGNWSLRLILIQGRKKQKQKQKQYCTCWNILRYNTRSRTKLCLCSRHIFRGFGAYTVWGFYTSCMLRHWVERSRCPVLATLHAYISLQMHLACYTQKNYKPTHSLHLYICITSQHPAVDIVYILHMLHIIRVYVSFF